MGFVDGQEAEGEESFLFPSSQVTNLILFLFA